MLTSGGDLQSYSLPGDLVYCAKVLGLSCRAHIQPGPYATLLRWRYPNEIARAEARGAQVLETASGALAANERELMLVSTWFLGLHYIVRRPGHLEDEFFDPRDGCYHQGFEAMNSLRKNYGKTGISITVQWDIPLGTGIVKA